MNTRLLDSPGKRVPIAVAAITGLLLVAAALYAFFGMPPAQPINGLKIIAAAHAYTRALAEAHLTVPPAVPLQTLIDKGLLQPGDVGALQGLDANISLMAKASDGAQFILMRVHLPDGTDLILRADGTAQEIRR